MNTDLILSVIADGKRASDLFEKYDGLRCDAENFLQTLEILMENINDEYLNPNREFDSKAKEDTAYRFYWSFTAQLDGLKRIFADQHSTSDDFYDNACRTGERARELEAAARREQLSNK